MQIPNFEPTVDLFKWFCYALQRPEDDSIARQAWHRVVYSYTQPHRYYHDLSHLSQLILDHIDLDNSEIGNLDQVRLLTIFYHDLIYIPFQGQENERKSALAFRTEARENLQISDDISKRVALEISMTSYNPKSLTAFGDFDFLSFSSPKRQKVNGWMVRREFSVVSDETFREGRLKFLDSLKAGLYYTDFFKAEFENVAQKNIAEEFDVLNQSYENWVQWTRS